MQKVTIELTVDFSLLTEQKLTLLHLAESLTGQQKADMKGIISLLDAIQDKAAEILGESVVFPNTDEIYSSWTINKPSEQKQPVVIDTHGNFRNTTGGIIFSGTVILQDEDSGREWPCSGEHSQRDYNWGKFWPDDDFESCPESPEIVELNDEEEAK
jgi:hypothetical protein